MNLPALYWISEFEHLGPPWFIGYVFFFGNEEGFFSELKYVFQRLKKGERESQLQK